ncbi:hypothetical protein [Mesorhizobium sp. 113-1-2]|uniref:hypothetical protein n=1 Tax=Mesorhizobium sp. 113-1-2 TaxID=2744515 RepID=UPI0019271D9D|nr:hypothetical protein [Mesorhizobium sp. 113-1-2]
MIATTHVNLQRSDSIVTLLATGQVAQHDDHNISEPLLRLSRGSAHFSCRDRRCPTIEPHISLAFPSLALGRASSNLIGKPERRRSAAVVVGDNLP